MTAHAHLATARDELERVIAAVERHRADRSPGRDARLYGEVLSRPFEAVDSRVDDPNDWPAPLGAARAPGRRPRG